MTDDSLKAMKSPIDPTNLTLCNMMLGVVSGCLNSASEAEIEIDSGVTKRRLLMVCCTALLTIVTDEEFMELKVLMSHEGAAAPASIEAIIEMYRYAHPFLIKASGVKVNDWLRGYSSELQDAVGARLLRLAEELRNAVRAESLILAGIATEGVRQ
jgi:hypothetical protein